VYLAPEVILRDKTANLANADVWACGVVLYIMLVGKYPFVGGTDYIQVCKNIVTLNFDIPHTLTPSAKDLLQKMFEKDHNKRQSIEELKNHPWVIGLDYSPDSPDLSS
jgi:serine/threonine protein kinase